VLTVVSFPDFSVKCVTTYFDISKYVVALLRSTILFSDIDSFTVSLMSADLAESNTFILKNEYPKCFDYHFFITILYPLSFLIGAKANGLAEISFNNTRFLYMSIAKYKASLKEDSSAICLPAIS